MRVFRFMVARIGKWRFSIFAKLALAFLVVISPVYALAKKNNDWGAKIVRNEISNSLMSQVHYYRGSLENEVDRIVKLQREYVNDDDLLALSITAQSMTYYERTTAMKRFQRRLQLLKESSAYVVHATAHIPPISRYISSKDMADELDYTHLEALLQVQASPESPFVFLLDKLYLREIYPNPPLAERRYPIFVLEQELSIPALRGYLQQLSGERGGAALMVNEQLTITSGGESESIVPSIELPSESSGLDTVTIGKEPYIIAYDYSPYLDASLLVYVPENSVMGALDKYHTYIRWFSIVAFMIILLFSYWIFRIIHLPLRKLVRAFHKVESGNMGIALRHPSNDEFRYLYDQFNAMVSHLKKLIYEVYEQKIHAQQSELKQLQSQINPHFLYNSFYLLYRMTKAEDNVNANKFTKYLGDYFQYITRSGNDEVTLEQEMNHVRAYAEIQSIRFSNRISATIRELPDDCKSVIVPRLILQPIVENAYHYGLEHTISGGKLLVSTYIAAEAEGLSRWLHIVIEDNGAGMPEKELAQWNRILSGVEAAQEITGMVNVHKRLQIKYGASAGVSLSSGEAGGLIVTLKLPVDNHLTE